MNDELTIEECDFAIKVKQEIIDYNKYRIRILNRRVDDLNNRNKMYEIDIKVLKFLQKNGFKLDVDFNSYEKTIKIDIDSNDKIIAASILEKTLFHTNTELVKDEMATLNQIKGFLMAIVSKPIIDEK